MPDSAAILPDHRPLSFRFPGIHLLRVDDDRPHGNGGFRRRYAAAGVKPGTGEQIGPGCERPFDNRSRECAGLLVSGRTRFRFPARVVFGTILPVLGITVFLLRPDEPSRVAVPNLLAAVIAITSPWLAIRAVPVRRSIDRSRGSMPHKVAKLGTNEK